MRREQSRGEDSLAWGALGAHSLSTLGQRCCSQTRLSAQCEKRLLCLVQLGGGAWAACSPSSKHRLYHPRLIHHQQEPFIQERREFKQTQSGENSPEIWVIWGKEL